jgi:hypothetical protein
MYVCFFQVYHLVVALLCYPDNENVVIAALETLASMTSIGVVTFAVRIVAHTDIINRLVSLLLRPTKGNLEFSTVINFSYFVSVFFILKVFLFFRTIFRRSEWIVLQKTIRLIL